MATLKQLVERKLDQIEWDEKNIDKGRVWAYSPGTEYTNYVNGFCWIACGTGKVILDVWGAGGSGAKMCCCGMGLPGNPGAWSRKCICVNAGDRITGHIGKSCNNADTLCFRGCSEATCVCWLGRNPRTGSAIDGCICAEGGRGGTTWCTPGGVPWRCFACNGYCATNYSNECCGLICNYGTATGIAGCATSYGGDINKNGGFSCTTMWTGYGNCPCSTHYHIAVPPGMFACEGAVVSFGTEADNGFSEWSGMGFHQFSQAINALSRQPSRGIPWTACYSQHTRACGCYDVQGCMPFFPPGVGGMAATPCGDVRSTAWRGGLGLVRINFIERE
jgi:hypothetical protein